MNENKVLFIDIKDHIREHIVTHENRIFPIDILNVCTISKYDESSFHKRIYFQFQLRNTKSCWNWVFWNDKCEEDKKEEMVALRNIVFEEVKKLLMSMNSGKFDYESRKEYKYIEF